MPASTEMTTDKMFRSESKEPATYDKKDEFKLSSSQRTYSNQFNIIYQSRVKQLKSRVFKMAINKWKNETINDTKASYVSKILDVQNLTPCYLIGTIFADLKYKTNVLKEVSTNMYGAPAGFKPDNTQLTELEKLRSTAYSDPKSDQIMLEDESGRIVLDGELIDKIVLVTGIVVGVLGMEVEPGIFTIVDIVYPEPSEQVPRSIAETGGNKVLFISGLKFKHDGHFADVELLKDYLMGEMTNTDDDLALLKSITNIVILGNSMEASPMLDAVSASEVKEKEKDKYREHNKSNFDASSIKSFDEFTSDLLNSIPVTILPGDSDPSEISLPKQPLHKSLFTNSSKFSNFKRTTNPSWLDVDELRILCTSGENINDIYKYMVPNLQVEIDDKGLDSPIQNEVLYESRLKLLEGTLRWQNIIPTAPDTLWCYPFDNEDPFTLNESPHVYAVGNQPKFESSVLEMNRKDGELVTVKVISVPEFSKTHQCVLMDTESLDCNLLEIGF